MQEHGGLDWSRLLDAGISPAEIIDFSVNVNPFGPCPGVREAIKHIDPAAYPDRSSHELTRLLAELNQVRRDEVLTGNGTAELIWLAAHAWLPGRRAAILSPTFGEYARAAQAAGAAVELLPAGPPHFRWDMDIILRRLAGLQPALVFLCNPNNPSGVFLRDEEVREIARKIAPGILILDEAYRTFVTLRPFAPPPEKNVLVLRSMTKDFGLAGLRLGYALGRPALIETLRKYQPPWSVNCLAQAAGVAALADLEYVEKSCVEIHRLSIDLRSALADYGASILPSETPYCLVNVESQGSARGVFDRLLGRGIQVRDCTSFGLPAYIRLGTRREEDNRRLVEIWKDLFYHHS